MPVSVLKNEQGLIVSVIETEIDADGHSKVIFQEKSNEEALKNSARWFAFINQTRVKFFGWAGIKRDGTRNETNYYGHPNGNYAHFGAEFWTTYGDFQQTEEELALRVKILNTYGDIAIDALNERNNLVGNDTIKS